jgi:hypothetical protein
MRASLGFPICFLVAMGVGCSSNTPLPIGNATGGAAGRAATGSGAGGAMMATSGAAGASTGIAGDGAPATGQAGGSATGVAGATATGEAGSTATGQAGASAVGAAGSSGITMCGAPTLPNGTCVSGAFTHNGGVCQCQDGTTCVCPNVGCIDPLTDDDNCGTCGVRCGPTSTCNNGVCGPPPVQVVPPQQGCGSIDLAIGGGMLYWTDAGHSTVKRMPLAGGVPATISNAEKGSKIVVSGTTAAWIYGDVLVHGSLDGGAPFLVVSSGSTIHGLVLTQDAAALFFSSDTNVFRVSVTNGAPVVIAHEVNGGLPGALALLGQSAIAYANGFTGDVDLVTLVPGEVVNCGVEDPMTGDLIPTPDCTRLARSQGELFTDAIFTAPSRVIWADGPNLKSEIPTSGGVFDIVSMSNDTITGLAGNATMAYFADTGAGTGVIYKSPVGTDEIAIRIARGQNHPRSLAVGDKKVYWSTADCSIMSQGL